ncbi:MAG TPA: hypothetical protein VMV78_08320 [Thiobacillus sp.]|nr:hypothetical protein [Thiobacillus sp.]
MTVDAPDLARMIFEHGIELRRDTTGQWVITTDTGHQKQVDPNALAARYGVRPVAAARRWEACLGRTYLLRTGAPRDLVLGVSDLFRDVRRHDPVGMFFSISALDFVLGALAYHCRQLAEAYVSIVSTARDMPHESDTDYVGRNHPAIQSAYYELESLLTSARRTYEMMRDPLWRLFGPGKGKAPDTLNETVKACDLPPHLGKRLTVSDDNFPDKLRQYRNCIQHCTPLDAVPRSLMTQPEPGIWAASCLIPDNPNAKDPRKFVYDKRIDALTYGWQVTNELADLTRSLVRIAGSSSKPIAGAGTSVPPDDSE